ncbi:hypothetical protein HMPREF3039_00972 [Akkermansia sp. KLE1798]|nr:hypothetical protein HMPREF3039_00972 [Akkermansia sp. KLE1798]
MELQEIVKSDAVSSRKNAPNSWPASGCFSMLSGYGGKRDFLPRHDTKALLFCPPPWV